VCDDKYGLSIGRGSFSWKVGGWTTVRQTVFLNTPGRQDGIFTLDVDGKRVISRSDVLYRDDLGETEKSVGKGKHKTTTKHTKTRPTAVKETHTSTSDDDNDPLGLGPLLSSLLGLRREVDSDDDRVKSLVITTVDAERSPSPELVARTPLPRRTPTPEPSSDVKFVGIFFRYVFSRHMRFVLITGR
jgi:hypothetical protein